MRLAAAVLCLLAAPVWAATACPEHYAGGRPPTIVKASFKPRTQELCFRAFSVVHSGLSRSPLWAAEHLQAADVDAASALIRKNAFHAEPRLPKADRAELSDYSRSGFQRGHMIPSDDMPDEAAQRESFSLANMVPQHRTPNVGIWYGIERAVRRLAREDGAVYVVTGPAYVGEKIGSLKGRVLIPTHVWKVVYSPRRGQAGAYLITNESDTSTYTVVAVSTLEQLVGLQLLPGVPQHVRDTAMALPPPTKASSARRKKGEPAPEVEYGMADRLRQAIEKLLKPFK